MPRRSGRGGSFGESRGRGGGEPAALAATARAVRPGDKVRLFLAAELSSAAMRDVARCAAELRSRLGLPRGQGRWVAPVSYHITVKFLGWTMPEVAEAISDVMTAALAAQPVKPFDIEGSGAGAFPSAERARVLWAGVADPRAGLTQLAALCEEALTGLGFASDTQPFHPHVTLARLKPAVDLRERLIDDSEQVFRRCRISALTLFESTLKSSGSEYTVRARFGLETGA